MAAPGLHARGEEKLGGYAVDPNAISVSGISSGGFMAQQYHVAHSKQIMGVGIVAAGPWDCADTVPGWLPIATAAQVCSNTANDGLPFMGPPNLAASVAATNEAAQADRIDPTKFLANAKVFLFSGSKDSLVPRSVMNELNQYYLDFVPAARVSYVTTVPAQHAMVTDGYGNACGHLGSPYINLITDLSQPISPAKHCRPQT
jgi:acetyl esterase/lipase